MMFVLRSADKTAHQEAMKALMPVDKAAAMAVFNERCKPAGELLAQLQQGKDVDLARLPALPKDPRPAVVAEKRQKSAAPPDNDVDDAGLLAELDSVVSTGDVSKLHQKAPRPAAAPVTVAGACTLLLGWFAVLRLT
jgi:hypothetical protein